MSRMSVCDLGLSEEEKMLLKIMRPSLYGELIFRSSLFVAANGETCHALEQKLHFAVREGRFRLVRILVEGGVHVNCRLGNGQTPLMTACSSFKYLPEETCLKIIRYLLRRGADASILDKFEKNALAYARSSSRKHFFVVKEMLQVHVQ